MNYIFDSDVLSSYLRAELESVRLLENLLPAGAAISSITYMEVLQGVLTRPTSIATEERFQEVVGGLPIISFNRSTAERCARIRHEFSLQGKRIRSRALDLMIAATAIEYDLTLVTRNHGDYSDIPELRLH